MAIGTLPPANISRRFAARFTSSRISTIRGRWNGLPRWITAIVHYTVVLLGCRDGDGNIFIVDEHAERLWLPQRHAAAIKAMLARHKIGDRKLAVEDLKRFVAGADVFSRQSDGTTIAAQYSKLGITLRCANTDRVNGWAEILQRSLAMSRPGFARHFSFTSGAGGCWKLYRRCNMIRIGQRMCSRWTPTRMASAAMMRRMSSAIWWRRNRGQFPKGN